MYYLSIYIFSTGNFVCVCVCVCVCLFVFSQRVSPVRDMVPEIWI